MGVMQMTYNRWLLFSVVFVALNAAAFAEDPRRHAIRIETDKSVGTMTFVVFNEERYLLTAFHVIADRPKSILLTHDRNENPVPLSEIVDTQFTVFRSRDLCIFKCNEASKKTLDQWDKVPIQLSKAGEDLSGREASSVGNPPDGEDWNQVADVKIERISTIGAEDAPVSEDEAKKLAVFVFRNDKIKAGFSGGPVVDNKTKELAGIVEGGNPNKGLSWAITSDEIRTSFERLDAVAAIDRPQTWPLSAFPMLAGKTAISIKDFADPLIRLEFDGALATGVMIEGPESDDTFLATTYDSFYQKKSVRLEPLSTSLTKLVEPEFYASPIDNLVIFKLKPESVQRIRERGRKPIAFDRLENSKNLVQRGVPNSYILAGNRSDVSRKHAVRKLKTADQMIPVQLSKLSSSNEVWPGASASNRFFHQIRGADVGVGYLGSPVFSELNGKLVGLVAVGQRNQKTNVWLVRSFEIKEAIRNWGKQLLDIEQRQFWPGLTYPDSYNVGFIAAQECLALIKDGNGRRGVGTIWEANEEFVSVLCCTQLATREVQVAYDGQKLIAFGSRALPEFNLSVIYCEPSPGVTTLTNLQERRKLLLPAVPIADSIPAGLISIASDGFIERRGTLDRALVPANRLKSLENQFEQMSASFFQFYPVTPMPAASGGIIVNDDGELIGFSAMDRDGIRIVVPSADVIEELSKIKRPDAFASTASPYKAALHSPGVYRDVLNWNSRHWQYAFRNDQEQSDVFTKFQEIRIPLSQVFPVDAVLDASKPVSIKISRGNKEAYAFYVNGMRLLGEGELTFPLGSAETLLEIKKGRSGVEDRTSLDIASLLGTNSIDVELSINGFKVAIQRSLPALFEYSVFVTLINDMPAPNGVPKPEAETDWLAINLGLIPALLANTDYSYHIDEGTESGTRIEADFHFREFSEIEYHAIGRQSVEVTFPISANLKVARFREYGVDVEVPNRKNIPIKFKARFQTLQGQKFMGIQGRAQAAKLGKQIKFTLGKQGGREDGNLQIRFDLTNVLGQLAVLQLNRLFDKESTAFKKVLDEFPFAPASAEIVQVADEIFLVFGWNPDCSVDATQIIGGKAVHLRLSQHLSKVASNIAKRDLGKYFGNKPKLEFSVDMPDIGKISEQKQLNKKDLGDQILERVGEANWSGQFIFHDIGFPEIQTRFKELRAMWQVTASRRVDLVAYGGTVGEMKIPVSSYGFEVKGLRDLSHLKTELEEFLRKIWTNANFNL